jgi:tRNA-specific 2-thiouridylase
VAAGVPLYVIKLDALNRRVVVGPRDALRTRRILLRDINWIGEGNIDEAVASGRCEVFVKVRSTRAPQPGWLMRGENGYEVELIDGEDGVSPGQACVFYDAIDGQARVLGGGFIRGTVAMTDALPAQKSEGLSAVPMRA